MKRTVLAVFLLIFISDKLFSEDLPLKLYLSEKHDKVLKFVFLDSNEATRLYGVVYKLINDREVFDSSFEISDRKMIEIDTIRYLNQLYSKCRYLKNHENYLIIKEHKKIKKVSDCYSENIKVSEIYKVSGYLKLKTKAKTRKFRINNRFEVTNPEEAATAKNYEIKAWLTENKNIYFTIMFYHKSTHFNCSQSTLSIRETSFLD